MCKHMMYSFVSDACRVTNTLKETKSKKTKRLSLFSFFKTSPKTILLKNNLVCNKQFTKRNEQKRIKKERKREPYKKIKKYKV